jgi:hypothetical protein
MAPAKPIPVIGSESPPVDLCVVVAEAAAATAAAAGVGPAGTGAVLSRCNSCVPDALAAGSTVGAATAGVMTAGIVTTGATTGVAGLVNYCPSRPLTWPGSAMTVLTIGSTSGLCCGTAASSVLRTVLTTPDTGARAGANVVVSDPSGRSGRAPARNADRMPETTA